MQKKGIFTSFFQILGTNDAITRNWLEIFKKILTDLNSQNQSRSNSKNGRNKLFLGAKSKILQQQNICTVYL
jgi:hypothetical protein